MADCRHPYGMSIKRDIDLDCRFTQPPVSSPYRQAAQDCGCEKMHINVVFALTPVSSDVFLMARSSIFSVVLMQNSMHVRCRLVKRLNLA